MGRVLLAYLLCDLIEFATWMAVVLGAFSRGGAAAVGAASVAMLLPAIVIVPLIAGFGDRVPRGRALSMAHAAVGVTSLFMCLLLVLDAPFWSVVVGGAVQTVALSLVQPMHYAVLPFLALRPGDLVAANGLSSFMDGATLFLGFLAAGVATEVVGSWAVLLACGVMGVVAALLTTGLRIARSTQTTDNDDGPGEIRAAFQGLRALRGNWGPLALLALIGSTFLIDGANKPLTLTFNAEVLGLGASSAGLLAGSYVTGTRAGRGAPSGGGASQPAGPRRPRRCRRPGRILARGRLRGGSWARSRRADAGRDGCLAGPRLGAHAAPAQHRQPHPRAGPGRPAGRQDERTGGGLPAGAAGDRGPGTGPAWRSSRSA